MIITLTVFLVLLYCVMYKAKIYQTLNPNFFDIKTTNVFRGIWSIIVIMVHIPKQYGNIIQDMAGSFAYIGVTFFFMASGFGLSQSVLRNKWMAKGFWSKRIPKLLIPQLMVNICAALLKLAFFGDKPTLSSLLWIARWLRWLMFCYLIFWLAHILCRSIKSANIFIFVSLISFSLIQYKLKGCGIITENIWSTEIFGFLWGILLSLLFSRIQNHAVDFWMRKTVILCIVALLLGVSYLAFKNVAFCGDYLLKIMLGLAIISFILCLNLRITLGNKALDLLGKISYELYLTHSVIISMAKRWMPDISSGVFIILILTCSLVMSVIIHTVSSKINEKISSHVLAGT